MSEIREKLLGSSALRSRAIKVVSLSIILVSAFAFSTAFISLIFDSQRNVPSNSTDNALFKETEINDIPFPFDLLDFLQFLLDLGLDVDDIDIETLLDMFDGVPEDLDLSQFAALLAAMLFSELEVFRVYNYSNLAEMEDFLWKYECFEDYNDGSWETSTWMDGYDLYSYNDYYSSYYPDPEVLTVKILNITPQAVGENEFAIPSLFPTPNIIEDSIYAPNLNPTLTGLNKQYGSSTYLDNLNSAAIIGYFTSLADTNLTYDIFGLNLTSDTEINNSAISPNAVIDNPSDPINVEYHDLIDHYTQFDGKDIGVYIAEHDNISNLYDTLNNDVINAGDNAFIIADKIRNHLQYNFNLSYNPIPEDVEDDDPINWFCKSEEGLYSDFASAFCALTRAFGVASRFVDGFNSREIEQMYDSTEDDDCFAVKYRNMYNWAEIFVPKDISGSGEWVQMDVYFDNFMGNPPPPLFGDDNFTLTAWTAYKDNPVNRDLPVIITATLLNNSMPAEGETISFIDLTTKTILPSNTTNAAGLASITVTPDNTSVVGPHVIKAVYNPYIANATHYLVNGPINVTLTSVTPQEINISETPHDIQVQGYVYDPVASEYVKHSNLNFVMLINGTSTIIPNAFIPFYTTTDENGAFDTTLEVNQFISAGPREIRADFNGMWNYTITHLGMDFPYPINDASGLINGSSNKEYLNITKATFYNLTLFINSVPPDNLNLPNVNRNDILELKAVLLNETDGPMSNVIVRFYNYTGGNVLIDQATTNPSGEAIIYISPGYNSTSGPNLVYAQVGGERNYSYYILNETPNITITSGPSPLVINKTAGEQFSVDGYLRDGVNSKPLNYSQVELRIFRGGVDYTSNLTGGANPIVILSDGSFSVTFGVDIDIPPGNYSVRLDFNGSYDLSTYPYSNNFLIPYLSTSKWTSNELQITYQAPLYFYFWINGTPSDDWENPIINRNEDLNLTALLMLGDSPLSGYSVEFWDKTQDDMFIGSAITDISGYATCIYETNTTTIAGPHLIYVKYSARYNYSYFIMNSPIIVKINAGPQPQVVNCTTSIGRNFILQGTLLNSTNGDPIKYGIISVHLFDGLIEITPISLYLNLVSGDLTCNETGEFYLEYYVESTLIAKNYTIQVWFNGTFDYTNPNNLNNEHYFDLDLLSNFSYSALGLYELDVDDPENISIALSVEGRPTPYPGSYNDLNKPERYNRGDEMHFQVRIIQDGSYVTSGTVYLINDYTDATITSYTFDGSEIPGGYVQLNVSSNLYHAGLYRLRVQYSSYSVLNKTYIIINETVTITPDQSNLVIFRDNIVSQAITGTITDPGYGGTIRGLRINLTLLDSNLLDVTSLYLDLVGSMPITVTDGTFSFTVNSILSDCPQGKYYLRIDFNGSLSDSWIFLTNYLINTNSTLITLDVMADTSIINANFNTSRDDTWYDGDTLWTWGNLLWDNLSSMIGVQVNVSVKDGSGTLLASNIGFTDGSGYFLTNITVDSSWTWGDTYVYVNFFPEDSFSAPEYYYIDDVTDQLVSREP